MSAMFQIWNFVQPTHDVCRFDVTRANMPRLGRGSRTWMEAALRPFGLGVAVAAWSLVPCRSFYFTDYPDAAEWRDRWRDCWTADVRMAEPQTLLPRHEPAAVEDLDPSWSEDLVDPGHDRRALLICDLDADEARARSVAHDLVAGVGIGAVRPESACVRVHADRLQVRALFEDVRFPEDAETLERALSACRDSGGCLNWRSSLLKRLA